MRHVVYDVSDIAMISCWIVFGVVWAAGALLERRRGAKPAREGGRDTASAVAALCGVLAVTTPDSIWEPLVVASPAMRLAGIPILVASTAAAAWARVALGMMWSSGALARENHVLRTTGPYRLTRHPIYAAIIGMVAGTALCEGIGRWALIFGVVTAMLAVKARAEERLLLREFGAAYGRYRQQVPGLIPATRRLFRSA
jgi:protein-S-isoprenylcysteine O-methyltransferase Ste14